MQAAPALPSPSSATPSPTPRPGGGLRSQLGMAAGLALFALMLVLPAPEGLSAQGWRTAAVAVLMATWWITEAIPIPATSLLPLVLFPALGIVNVTTAAAPYANPVIYLFMGGFMIAIALEACGLHRRLALGILRRVGTQPGAIVGGFMVATGFLSMWISNTATVLMMLPMALSVLSLMDARIGGDVDTGGTGGRDVRRDQNFGIALLLGLAYAANIGGLGTLIGTPPNALLAGYMQESHGIQIGFLEWMVVGVPLVVVALPLAWLLLVRVLHPVRRESLAAGAEMLRSEAAALGGLSRAERVVGAITTLTALGWITRPLLEPFIPGLNDTSIAMFGALLLFVVPVRLRRWEFAIGWKAAERLPWAVLLLFGGGLSLAGAIQTSGLATWLGDRMTVVEGWPILAVAIAVTAVVIFLTELTSNTATAATFLPVVAALAAAIGAAPMLLTVPTAIAASCAFMMPVATPPNALVYGSERIAIPQMARAGLVLNLLFIALIPVAVFLVATRVLGIAGPP